MSLVSNARRVLGMQISRCSSRLCMPRALATVHLKMPKIMSAKNGSLDKWLKAEGQPYKKGEAICEITLDGVTIGLQLREPGVLVRQLLNEGQVADIGADVGIIADSHDSYLEYLDQLRIQQEEEEFMKHVTEVMASPSKEVTNIEILRHIKHMLKSGKLEDRAELVSGLLALARKGDKQLMDIFKASCDDNNYNEDTFDNDFFIENIENMLKLSSNKKIEK